MDKKTHKSFSNEVSETKSETTDFNQKKPPIEAKIVKDGNIPDDNLVITQKEKLRSIVGYIGFLCILPLVTSNSKFCSFHGKQSLVLFVFFILISWVGLFGWLLQFIIFVSYIIAVIISMINTAQGKMFRLPFISKVADKIDI